MELNVPSSSLPQSMPYYWAKLGQWRMTFSNIFFLWSIHINARTEKPEHSRKKKGKEGRRDLPRLLCTGTITQAINTSLERCGLKGINNLLKATGSQEVSGGIPKLGSLCCQSQCPEHHTITLLCLFFTNWDKKPYTSNFWGLISHTSTCPTQSYTPWTSVIVDDSLNTWYTSKLSKGVYIQRKWNEGIKEISVFPCSSQHYSQ